MWDVIDLIIWQGAAGLSWGSEVWVRILPGVHHGKTQGYLPPSPLTQENEVSK